MAGERQPTFLRVGDPFGGLSCLPWRWENGRRAAVAVNVDPDRGTVRPRQGCAMFRDLGATVRVVGAHGFIAADGTPLVAAVAQSTTTAEAFFVVMKSNGDYVCYQTMQSLSAGLLHPPDEDGRVVSWADYGGIVRFAMRHGAVYQYDYLMQPGQPTVALAVAPTNNINVPYLEDYPKGNLLVEHMGELYVAGFDGEQWHQTNMDIPDEQTSIQEANISPTRGAVKYGPSAVLVSDGNDPAAFQAAAFFTAAAGQRVRGLASDPAGLLVFTERSVYLSEAWTIVGFSGVQARPRRLLVRNVGCVGQQCIAQGRGMTVWLAHDGIYAYESGSIRRISDDIADLWTEEGWRPRAMSGLAGTLERFGYPWRISRSLLDRACAGFDELRQQFWFAVPNAGSDTQNALNLIWSPITQEWTFYAGESGSTAATTSALFPLCFSGLLDGSRWRYLIGTESGALLVYGEATTDPNLGRTDPRQIVAVWQSAPLSPDRDRIWDLQSARVRQDASADVGTAVTLHLEHELGFDVPDQELSSQQALVGRPSEGPPSFVGVASVPYVFNNGDWNAFRWHSPGQWVARYPAPARMSAGMFQVGIGINAQTNQTGDVHDVALELVPSKDRL